MSWSLGNKKWTIPFMSLNGTSCHIDIYKRGYTGTVITLSSEVSGAPGFASENPFFFEEDEDEDLLKVVRIKTGYINLVETVSGGLDDLFPATNTDHYVEFYYGLHLKFTGFIQAQSFEAEWIAAPREVSLPIISPLGLLDSYKFTVKSTPSWLTLGEIFDEILAGTDGAYKRISFPGIGQFGISGAEFDYYTIASQVICPMSSGTTQSEIFEPKSYLTFIEAVCKFFGLMVHDIPNEMAFTKHDWTGNYFYYGSSFASFTPSDYNLDSAISITSDENTLQHILPLSEIDINYDGEKTPTQDLNFGYCSKREMTVLLTDYYAARVTPVIGYLQTDNPAASGTYINSDGKLTSSGIVFAAFGKDSLAEQIIMQQNATTAWSGNAFKWTVFNWANMPFRFKFSLNYGVSIENLDNNIPGYINFNIRISCGDLMWDATNQVWSSSGSILGYGNFGGGDVTVAVSAAPGVYAPLVLEVIPTDIPYDDGMIFSFTNIKVEIASTIVGDYVLSQQKMERTIYGNPSPNKGEIDSLLNIYENTINTLVKTTASGLLTIPTYPYMFTSQTRLTVTGSLSETPLHIHASLTQFDSSTWKVIAEAFYPWNDEYKLILHHN